MTEEEIIEERSRNIFKLLCEKRYGDIEAITHGVRLSGNDIRDAISEYGKEICAPPEGEEVYLDIIKVKSSFAPTYSVVFNLWTLQEGPSDLAVEMTIRINSNDASIEIDNIHVR